MFQCIKSSIKENVRETIFTQAGNLPTNTDEIALFKKLTTFTSIASLQLSLLSFNSILEYNPLDFDFDIPKINTKLNYLFVLATTQHRSLDEAERIQHTLSLYSKILQPETWAQWVREKIDSFKDGNITICQTFMNSAMVKYKKLTATGGFKGYVYRVQEDIVALFASKSKTTKTNFKTKHSHENNDEKPIGRPLKRDVPDFISHYKENSSSGKYKVGDTKEHKGATYHFYDAPNHRNRAKWHLHHAEECRVRKNWLKKQE